MSSDSWAMIDAQLAAATSAVSAEQVCEIMPPDADLAAGDASGFFVGSTDENTLFDALQAAGWSYRWIKAPYHWCMEAPDGSKLTYVEGDLYIGDQLFPHADPSASRHAAPDDPTDAADPPLDSAAHVAAADFPGPPAEPPPAPPSEPTPTSSATPPNPERSPRHSAR